MKEYQANQTVVTAMQNTFSEPIYIGKDKKELKPDDWLVQYDQSNAIILNNTCFTVMFSELNGVPEKPRTSTKPRLRKRKTGRLGSREWIAIMEIAVDVLKGHFTNQHGTKDYLAMKHRDLLRIVEQRHGKKVSYHSFRRLTYKHPRMLMVMKGYYKYDPPENHQLVFAAPNEDKTEAKGSFFRHLASLGKDDSHVSRKS